MGERVRNAARLNVRSVEPYFKRTRRPGARNGRVESVQAAHPAAWQVALKLAGGDCRRVELAADGSVIVLNRPRPAS